VDLKAVTIEDLAKVECTLVRKQGYALRLPGEAEQAAVQAKQVSEENEKMVFILRQTCEDEEIEQKNVHLVRRIPVRISFLGSNAAF
jgi:hypothetical protein